MIILSKPLYIQLSETLIEQIKHRMTVGDLLPSERKLTKIYNVSRTTVRLALDYLEALGYISTQHGRGSFVVDYHKTMINLSEMYSFTEQMKTINKVPQTILLGYSVVSENETLNEVFNHSEKKFIKLVRLRLANSIPMMYEETYIPFYKFNNISIDDINSRSLYNIFKEDYNEIVKLAQEEFSAGIATKSEAELLDIDNNSAVLKIFRTTINLNNEVIEYTESKARSDKFSYRTEHYNHLI